MKKFKIIILIVLSLFIVSCGKKENRPDTKSGTLENVKYKETEEVTNYIKIDTDLGLILLELYPDTAPKTVENFQKLVKEKFYDDALFYRMVSTFMIQGGQATQSKEAETITGEFEENGIDNSLKHERGVISMARTSNNMNSASSEFFIVHKYSASSKALNGKYAAFGMTLAGFDTIDKIVKVETYQEYAVNPVKIYSIRFIEIE